MILLAVDLGNTAVKAAVFRGGRLVRRGFPAPGQRPDAVAVSSVSPASLARLLPRLRRLGAPVRLAGRDFPVPLAHPPGVGTDRLLAAYAAWRRARGPAVVVAIGTAATLNVVDGRGRFLGGALFAGPGPALEALAARAALLPRVAPARAPLLARDTRAALRAGALLAYRGFAKEGLAAAERRLGRRPAVFLTGGGARLLAGALPGARLTPDLVLEGLALLQGL